jgi:predicted transcriptional regulator
MDAGGYESPDEVVARALEAFSWEDDWSPDEKEEIAAKIERGLAQFDRGEFFTAEESRADMETRKAAWLAEHER